MRPRPVENTCTLNKNSSSTHLAAIFGLSIFANRRLCVPPQIAMASGGLLTATRSALASLRERESALQAELDALAA